MINELPDDDDDVRLVPTLQAACLTKISTELWNNWNASELLAAAVKNNFQTSKSAHKKTDHSITIEKIISEILQSSLPDGLRLQLATAFCEHNKKLSEWAIDLKTILQNPTDVNIHYGIAKSIVTQHGNIDKARSILNMMLESYLRIKFQEFTISIRVWIDKKVLKSFLRSRTYTDYWIWLKKMKICISFMQPLRGYNIIMNFLNISNDSQINELILVETYKNASLKMWNFVLTKLEKNNPEMYSLTLAHSLITKHPDTKRVIQIYEHLDDNLQTKFIKIFGIQLVELMFRKHEDICVQMFDQVCRYHGTQKCAQLLEQMILCALIAVVPQSPQTTKVLNMRLKQMFLKLWYQTPNPVKEEVLTKPQEYVLTSVIGEADYHLLSILVTVNTCSQEQKNKLIIEVIARVAGKPLHIEKCLQELPEYYNMQFVKDTLRSMLKECFRAPQKINDYDALTNLVFDCKESTDEFKRTLFSDKEFVTDALSNLANDEGDESVMAFLNWGFNNNSIALKNFIDKYIKSEQWLIELYQKYLCMTQNYCTDFLLGLFLADEEEKTNIKRILRQDRDMVLKVLDQLYSGKYFLRCIFDKEEKKQKCELVEEYFSSESGSKRVYDLVTGQVSIKHFSSYFRYGLPKVIRNMFDFKKNWIVSVKVRDIIREVVRPENFQECIKNNVSNCEVWLPFENERQLKTILETNVRLLEMIMDSDMHISNYLQEIKRVPVLADYQQTAEQYLNIMDAYRIGYRYESLGI